MSDSKQPKQGYFELFPTILIRAETIEDADRLFCDILDNAVTDDMRCFGWTTLTADDDAADVFAGSGDSCGTTDAKQELQEAEAAHEAASRRYEQTRERRNAVIRQALTEGWTHQQIADATGLSRGRISQLPR